MFNSIFESWGDYEKHQQKKKKMRRDVRAGKEAASCPCDGSLVGAREGEGPQSHCFCREWGREKEGERQQRRIHEQGGFSQHRYACLPHFYSKHSCCSSGLKYQLRCVWICVFLNIIHPAHCLHPLSSRQPAVILLRRTRQKLSKRTWKSGETGRRRGKKQGQRRRNWKEKQEDRTKTTNKRLMSPSLITQWCLFTGSRVCDSVD